MTCTVALVGATVFAPSAFAEPTLTGPEVVQFPQEPQDAVINGDVFVLQGTLEAGGDCTFDHSLTLSDDEQAIAEHELARDPSTCRSLIERGTPVTLPSAAATDQTETLTISGDPGSIEQSATAAARTVRKQVTSYVYHEDPIGINVTELWDTITWNPNRRCADAGRATGDIRDDWYEQSGWYRFVRQSTPASNCNRVQLVTNATYENDTFCGLRTTWVDYNPNRVQGFARGKGARHTWTQRTRGHCTGLLSFHRVFYRNS